MRTRLAFLLVAAVAAGCGGGDPAPEEPTGYRFFDHAFIDTLVAHHRAAIELAQKAKGNGLSEPALIGIADAVVTRDTNEIDQLLDFRNQWFGSETVRADEDPLATLGLMAAEAGVAETEDIWDAVDTNRTFAELMRASHRAAIRLGELVEGRGEHFELQDLAQGMVRASETELRVLEQYPR